MVMPTVVWCDVDYYTVVCFYYILVCYVVCVWLCFALLKDATLRWVTLHTVLCLVYVKLCFIVVCGVLCSVRDGGAELRDGGGLEIKIQHFVCFSGKFHNKCFKALLFQHYIWKKSGGTTAPRLRRP